MLTGTLVTVASFLPIGLNSSNAGEYTFSLFVVIAISLLLSWLVAVVFTPLLGVTLLPKALKKHEEKPSRISAIFRRLLDLVDAAGVADGCDLGRLIRRFTSWIEVRPTAVLPAIGTE